jgi:hypothetical protein
MKAGPASPCLVIRGAMAFWVEPRPFGTWVATPESFREGCFDDASCYDETGTLWPIVAARWRRNPSWLEKLFSRPVAVDLELGDARSVSVAEIVARLDRVLSDENEFCDQLPGSPASLRERFAGARTPRELIRLAGEAGTS